MSDESGSVEEAHINFLRNHFEKLKLTEKDIVWLRALLAAHPDISEEAIALIIRVVDLGTNDLRNYLIFPSSADTLNQSLRRINNAVTEVKNSVEGVHAVLKTLSVSLNVGAGLICIFFCKLTYDRRRGTSSPRL